MTAPDGITYKVAGNSCAITVALDEGLVGKAVTITLTDKDGKYGTNQKTVGVIAVG